MKKILSSLVMAAVLALSACNSFATTQPSDSNQVATVVAGTMQDFPSHTPEPTVGPVCPEPVTGTQLLRNDEYGYCFLFPDDYVRLDPLPYEVCLVPEGPSMACHGANLIIEVHEATGRTASQIADEKMAEHVLPESLERTSLTIAGEDAIVVDGLSGVAASRSVFIVYEDRMYDLMFIPWDESDTGFELLETLYTTVMDSITFVP